MQLKNRDNLLGLNYRIELMDTATIRQRIMKDHQLSDQDLFFCFSEQSSLKFLYYTYTNQEGELKEERLFPDLPLTNKQQLWAELHNAHPNQMTRKCVGVNETTQTNLYEEIPYDDAIQEILTLQLELFNQQRAIDDLAYRQIIENGTVILNERADGKLELIDGFYRTLYKTPNAKVLVKIYQHLTDAQWIQLMMNANHWKSTRRHLFYDRGFLLGLTTRYQLQSPDFYLSNRVYDLPTFLDKMIHKPTWPEEWWEFEYFHQQAQFNKDYLFYCSDEAIRQKVLTTPTFLSDLTMMPVYLHQLPTSVLNHRSLKTIEVYQTTAYEFFMEQLIRYIFIFRYLHQNEEMLPLSPRLLDQLFANKTILDAFVKACKISTPAHIENRLAPLLVQFKEVLETELLK